MKDQTQQNKEWSVDYPSNVGTVTILTAPSRKVPGLPLPYQYALPEARINALKEELKAALAPFPDIGPRRKKDAAPPKLQCKLIEFKRLGRGVRLNVFLLGYRPGLIQNSGPDYDNSGITQEEWMNCTTALRECLILALGPEVSLYVEPWTEGEKFQARFETYIMRSEAKASA